MPQIDKDENQKFGSTSLSPLNPSGLFVFLRIAKRIARAIHNAIRSGRSIVEVVGCPKDASGKRSNQQ